MHLRKGGDLQASFRDKLLLLFVVVVTIITITIIGKRERERERERELVSRQSEQKIPNHAFILPIELLCKCLIICQ